MADAQASIDLDSEARLREAIAALVADMDEIRRLRDENAALRERHRAIDREVELAQDALSDLKNKRPVPLWLAIVRGVLRPDLGTARRNWPDLLRILARLLAGIALLVVLLGSR